MDTIQIVLIVGFVCLGLVCAVCWLAVIFNAKTPLVLMTFQHRLWNEKSLAEHDLDDKGLRAAKGCRWSFFGAVMCMLLLQLYHFLR